MNYSEEDRNFYKKYPNGVKDPLHLFHTPIVNSNQEYENGQIDTDGILKEIKTSYKGVDIESGVGMLAMKFANYFDDVAAIAITDEGYTFTRKVGIDLDKERVLKWLKMCIFLEESATDEDKKNIGALLYCHKLEKTIEQKDKYIEQLIRKIGELKALLGDDD